MLRQRFIKLFLCALPMAVQTAQSGTVEFNRDIRPILSDRCYTCHGPSQSTRVSKLRLDIPADENIRKEILRRVSLGDQPGHMPAAGPALSGQQIGLIRQWIEEGGAWQKHWSLIPPTRPAVPTGANAIDYFIRARLQREGLEPSPEADRPTLIRRVTFDLTGLPPTPEEIDAFMADRSPDAYEKLVDRLLASPRYGERMAIVWLDAARYADTNGYQTDGERYMWRWRDWVVDSFNHNQPYDQFTVQQIAGDLLPNATLDQRIASGFNRNHRGNGEGGIVPAEYAVEYVVDRVDTMSTVFLGLTVGCARCHDHKYDPITQREYYQLYAYFNNIPERGNAQKYGNSPPLIKAPTPAQQTELQRLDQAIAAAEKQVAAGHQSEWETTLAAGTDWFSQRQLDSSNAGDFGFLDRFTLAARVNSSSPNGSIFSRMKDESEGPGYQVILKDGKIHVNLVLRWLDDAIRVETADALELNRPHHVAVTWDGSRFADGLKVYVDGAPQQLKINLDQMNQNFAVKVPLRIGGNFHGVISDVHVYRTDLTPDQVAILATPENLNRIAAIPPSRRTPAQSDKIRLAYLDTIPEWKILGDLREQRAHYYDSIQTVMVMQELPTVHDTFLLKRGAYDRPGERVERGVPAVLPPLPNDVVNNRLALARWIASPANPLTARVAVNRYWQMYFGTGIVKTVEDFGSQGEWPGNPELLDWLATEFMRTGWNVKAMQKTIVMSAAYRQSSKASAELLQRDPENRLVARGPRFRLPAEAVRDQALAVSGLLVENTGGPSVKPYQPPGLWEELSGGEGYHQDHGAALYRRSLYTFWKRASPPPMMASFDSAGREACSVRANRTNTPLQALDLMNDITFVEASRMLAQRMMKQGDSSSAIDLGFRLATARFPTEHERSILLQSFRYNLDRYQTHPQAALDLLIQGETPRDTSLNPAELAAWTNVASLILNLDETVTRQ
jgi:hypothetical protein